mmetsp:Transcript_7100/g.7984  ORF Transcript_7100/g.7984 Transcript_7100/m.7984 type:complete len:303 (+) Transcript_7100:33-941(+)|eukprot:CAMPEP_0205822182 /NCGR_PEP_ID=MMETSP0206-20130828/11314_1 /ASSEMBLY_ACC=CAM_ASM_000279 /TAXON_ID=36767 /ORGANISM="Euplotes focardii, Strain TN1" /LENGTH=302 /DNA_ID=CAMNT_0053118221 /DNA_START=33 /DNA_END=941 /DNA_ORIENTATION=-
MVVTAMDWTANGRKVLLRNVKEFRAYAPSLANSSEHTLNILTIGERGSGKSSYLNAMLSTVRQRLTELFHAAPSAGDVTTKQSNLSLEPFGLKMGIRDVPGWTSSSNWPTYMRLLRCIISGRTRDQEDLLPLTEDLLLRLEARPAASFEHQIHCIVILRSIEDDRPAFVEKVTSIVQEFDTRVPVMVLLTKVDTKLAANATLENVHAMEDFEGARLKLAKDVCIEANRVLPLASYGGGVSYPNIHVEILVLSALQRAQALAEKALQVRGLALQRLASEAGPSAQAAAGTVPTPGSAGSSAQT